MSIVLHVFILLFYTATTIATSANATTIGWVDDPNGRGTFGLVSSCLLTLGLCVWSAMHLNVPPRDESPLRFWARNLKWGLVGVVAPELVVFAAWRQYNSAKELQDEVRSLLNVQQPVLSSNEKYKTTHKDGSRTSGSECGEPTYPWTMVHSFYAGMGGFILEPDTSADDTQEFMPRNTCLTLTARGTALLARCGHLPNIPKDDINDKSKADALAKSLVCVQALWMVIQVIGRVVAGLPVTLLEVNILGHVLCALVIYVLWWHKPRSVLEPTRLEGDWVKPLFAYMYMSSQISGKKNIHPGILRRTWYEPELSGLAFFTPRVQAIARVQSIVSSTVAQESTTPSHEYHKTPDANDGTYGSVAEPGFFGPRPGVSDQFQTSGVAEQGQKPDQTQLIRWHLAAEAVRLYPDLLVTTKSHKGSAATGPEWSEPLVEELVTAVAGNWPSEDLLRGTGGLIMGMVLWCASMAYGGVHIAAWYEYFPSKLEAWLWRSSAIYIAWSGGVWLTINLLARLSNAIDAYWDRVLARRAHWASYVVLGTLCSVCGVAYGFARIFLVVEAFISIRRLPVEAYQTPNWTEVIPHL
ncbi:hypothetical protein D0Z07_5648 [Hyphodiscus hymeniophilus]|uniref:Uncharacterized protein n=1 Tax=Hyphodiscus hymeniophilus TaxID=353542 RepID=A0A9P6VHK5_9HELO|nr:hypothetical protein D0Z07_5648 [Hyphodiscus hymeniophilus]